ncbi:uncharacterized protein LAESUDRAFT_115087 [Laetiporus sulphureus 93-53]|uniref:Uncharacterized protein n=1 Tax=Laetiporus sulphureus 93-53 TaxID=1314785 RepID=A0A165EQB5_9APHY|nr:uncharacterized protein LAESUDRAFT_115087 [Laetiporus sulphureus 93-53]KZT07543.1 hypothetical protein LAESUDRAFT_115087 [Laetiporus sulphureus 93-53]
MSWALTRHVGGSDLSGFRVGSAVVDHYDDALGGALSWAVRRHWSCSPVNHVDPGIFAPIFSSHQFFFVAVCGSDIHLPAGTNGRGLPTAHEVRRTLTAYTGALVGRASMFLALSLACIPPFRTEAHH